MDGRRRIAPTLGPPPVARRPVPAPAPVQRAVSPPRQRGSVPAGPASTVPPPRKVRHVSTLWWWLGAALIALAVYRAQGSFPESAEPALLPPGNERESFVAFVYGRVADRPDTFSPVALRAQLQQLQAAGAHIVGLGEVQAFYKHQTPLPSNPVLLVFDEARRETVEAVDPILAELGLRAVAFLNVAAVESGNVDLVSRRRLKQMTASGRWQVGLSACHPASAAPGTVPTAVDLRRRLNRLEEWSARPALAGSCVNGWRDTPETQAMWSEALSAASLPLGFVGRAAAGNRADEPPSALRLIPMDVEDVEPDALVRRLAAYTPRHRGLIDEFREGRLNSAWVASRKHFKLKDGHLHLSAGPNDSGGALTLGGTERWQDARITVQLDAAPAGEFWIYARRAGPTRFVRLGIIGESDETSVVLQRSDPDGQTRQLAQAPLPHGAARLTLRVIGSRAIALLNDQPLLDRPLELPARVDQGEVALVSWSTAGPAQATLRRVDIEPLPRQLALLDPAPGDDDFELLRREADAFWAVSPRVFRWRGGRGWEADETAMALEMFAGHQRLTMLPAVIVDRLPDGRDWERFSSKLEEWAQRPQYAGLNLVLDRVRPGDLERIAALRSELQALDKELAVTVSRGAADLPQLPGYVLFAGSGSRALQAATNRHLPG